MDNLIVYVPALLGGVLIGSSALLLMFVLGRVAGISGILSNLLSLNWHSDKTWRFVFIAGLVLGVVIYQQLFPMDIPFRQPPSAPLILLGGFLVGFGTHLGSGCTSGHGVCGIGRFSIRSMIATATFMLAAGVTVFVVNHLLG